MTTIYKPCHRVYPVTGYKEENGKTYIAYKDLLSILCHKTNSLSRNFTVEWVYANTHMCIYRPNVGRVKTCIL